MKLINITIPIEELYTLLNLTKDEPRVLITEEERLAIRERLINEMRTIEAIQADKKLKNEYKNYELCVFCGKVLSKPKKPYKFKQFNITELRPCCHCLNQYKGISLNDLPEVVRKNIENSLKKR